MTTASEQEGGREERGEREPLGSAGKEGPCEKKKQSVDHSPSLAHRPKDQTRVCTLRPGPRDGRPKLLRPTAETTASGAPTGHCVLQVVASPVVVYCDCAGASGLLKSERRLQGRGRGRRRTMSLRREGQGRDGRAGRAERSSLSRPQVGRLNWLTIARGWQRMGVSVPNSPRHDRSPASDGADARHRQGRPVLQRWGDRPAAVETHRDMGRADAVPLPASRVNDAAAAALAATPISHQAC